MNVSGKSLAVMGTSGPLPRSRSTFLRWSSVSNERILGVRSSRIDSARAIFGPWSDGTTSSSVRTLAIMPSSGGFFFSSASARPMARACSGPSARSTVGVT